MIHYTQIIWEPGKWLLSGKQLETEAVAIFMTGTVHVLD